MNDDTSFSEVVDGIDLELFLDYEGVDYRRGGGGNNLNLRECPFCKDDRYKVYFDRVKKTGICFHGDCNAHFNLFSFTRALLDTDNRGTFERIRGFAKQSGIISPVKVSAPVVPSEWVMPNSIPLPTPEGFTHPFLLGRRITPETQETFGVRWCEKGWWKYKDNEDQQRFMNFDNRLIIPIQDMDGSVQSFIGRDVTGEADKKYLFPATLPSTGRFLYGANLIQNEKRLVIGEGTFDTWAIRQSILGIPEFKDFAAVGSFGLSIGMGGENDDDQLHRLLQLRETKDINSLVFMWDGEHRALMAAIKTGLKLASLGFDVSVSTLPYDSDPNEVDTEIVRQAIRNRTKLDRKSAMEWTLRSPYAFM